MGALGKEEGTDEGRDEGGAYISLKAPFFFFFLFQLLVCTVWDLASSASPARLPHTTLNFATCNTLGTRQCGSFLGTQCALCHPLHLPDKLLFILRN